jgi:ABC-type lipoprotein release transport system permease subunit
VSEWTNWSFNRWLALGARAGDIIRMLLGQSLRPILVGLLLGTLGGYGLGRALNGMFFRMTTAEPMVFAGIASMMRASIPSAVDAQQKAGSLARPSISLG